VRCIVIQTAYVGDVILTLPLLDLLRASGRAAWVAVLAAREGAEFLRLQGAANEVIAWDKRGRERGLRGTVGAARALRALDADLALVPHRSFRSALLPALAGVRDRAGFDESGGRLLLTRTVPYRARPHEIERIALLAGAAGVALLAGRVPFSVRVRPEDAARAARLLEEEGVAPGQAVVVVAPGSRWPTKRWLPERFAAAAAALAGDLSGRVVIAGSTSDRESASAVASALAPPPVNATARLDMGAWIALIARGSILLSNDSAAAHVAAGVGTPVVAVFGPTVPDMGFAPYAARSRVVGADLPCRPCGRHGHRACPLGHLDCMRLVTAEEVVAAGRELLAR